MIKFILKRLVMMIPVLLGVTLVVFTIMYFTPGDPASIILGDMATEEDRAIFNEEHGLNGSFIEQYVSYMKRVIVHGDLGTSYTTKMSVTSEILSRFPTTFKLAGVSILLACVIGIVCGIISATRQYSVFDRMATAASLIGVSLPNFWQGMMLVIVFSAGLGWFPPSGFSTPRHWVLPAVTIGTSSAANIMRMTRSSMLEIVRQDYIRTARSKGQREEVVIWKHALRNALIPIITVIGLSFGKLLGGAVLTESIFSTAGIGKLMVDAIKAKNTPLVQGGVLFIAVVMCFVNLLVDILYAFVDPKIRSQYMKSRRTAYQGKEEANG